MILFLKSEYSCKLTHLRVTVADLSLKYNRFKLRFGEQFYDNRVRLSDGERR